MLSCSVLYPLRLSKCYIQLTYCRNSSVLSFHQKKVIRTYKHSKIHSYMLGNFLLTQADTS